MTTENEKQKEILNSITGIVFYFLYTFTSYATICYLELEIAKSNLEKSRQVAAYQASAEAEMKQIECQKIVEEKRTQQKIEERRAVDYFKALVEAEVKTKDMEGSQPHSNIF